MSGRDSSLRGLARVGGHQRNAALEPADQKAFDRLVVEHGDTASARLLGVTTATIVALQYGGRAKTEIVAKVASALAKLRGAA